MSHPCLIQSASCLLFNSGVTPRSHSNSLLYSIDSLVSHPGLIQSDSYLLFIVKCLLFIVKCHTHVSFSQHLVCYLILVSHQCLIQSASYLLFNSCIKPRSHSNSLLYSIDSLVSHPGLIHPDSFYFAA